MFGEFCSCCLTSYASGAHDLAQFCTLWMIQFKPKTFQEKTRQPRAWALRKESELLQIFNYYLDKMRLSGVTERLHQKFFGELSFDDTTSKTEMQDITQTGLRYEDVLFPFMALLTGICIALLQLGMETVVMCKKKYTDDGKHLEEDESKFQIAEEIIDDIHALLKEHHVELGGITFLTKIRMLSSPQDATHQ